MGQLLGQATAFGSLVLVGVTIWYAWQTQQMVHEMRDARVASLRPNLRLDLSARYGLGTVDIENVGVGPAISVSVDLLVLVDNQEVERRHWSAPLLRSGERRTMLMPNVDGVFGNCQSAQYWAELDARVALVGTCLDLDGGSHRVDDVLSFAAHADPGPQGSWESVEDRVPANIEAIAQQLDRIAQLLADR